MTRNYHTALPFKPAALASVFNTPLGELDAALQSLLLTATMSWQEQTSVPTSPRAGRWKLFASASNINTLDSNGLVSPLQFGGQGSITFIERQQLGAPAVTIDFNPVAGSVYPTLIAQVGLRGDRAAASGGVLLRLNGSSSVIYNYSHSELVTATTRTNGTSVNAMQFLMPEANAPTDWFTHLWLIFWRSNSTTLRKRVNWFGLLPLENTHDNMQFSMGGGNWNNSSNAIDRITFLPRDSTNFIAGSYVDLYGITQ